jgi:hypothetical protein
LIAPEFFAGIVTAGSYAEGVGLARERKKEGRVSNPPYGDLLEEISF